MDVIQQFIDSCVDVSKWLSQSREKLSKCAMPSGDRDVLRDKTNKIKVLSIFLLLLYGTRLKLYYSV